MVPADKMIARRATSENRSVFREHRSPHRLLIAENDSVDSALFEVATDGPEWKAE